MELIERVESLIVEINKTHKYSMSRIYGLYNEVFGLAETPQSCASCLLRKVNELKKWLDNQQKMEENKIKEQEVEQQNTATTKSKRGRKAKTKA